MNADALKEIFHRGCAAYRAGERRAADLVDQADRRWLLESGLRAQVIYDFVEDFCSRGEPSPEDFYASAAIRNAYFVEVMNGRWLDFDVPEPDLPARDAEVGGIPWLPRIVKKADCFLKGTLCPEIMYGCGGDRAFLKRHGLSIPGFLEAVRDLEADPVRVREWIVSRGLSTN